MKTLVQYFNSNASAEIISPRFHPSPYNCVVATATENNEHASIFKLDSRFKQMEHESVIIFRISNEQIYI